MLQRKDKYLNVILLALEFPFACFLALFTLDGSSSMHAFKEHPWAIFMERFLFTLIPILSVVFLFLLSLNISFILFYKDKNPRKTFTYKFFAIHTLHVSLMVLLLLLVKRNEWTGEQANKSRIKLYICFRYKNRSQTSIKINVSNIEIK